MKNIIKVLEDRKMKDTRAFVIANNLSDFYWSCLPDYASIYIKPAYDLIFDLEGLYEFVSHFLVEYSESNNDAKKLSIESVVFPIYKSLTGLNYDTDYFKPLI